MADEAEVTPVKRGPGRPRKVAVPEAAPEVVAPPTDPDDSRLGQPCDPSWRTVTYGDDGSCYRCENGFHVERVA